MAICNDAWVLTTPIKSDIVVVENKNMTKSKIKSKDLLKGMRYQKPEIKLEKVMTFMFDALKKKPSKISCRQCSSCHGCR